MSRTSKPEIEIPVKLHLVTSDGDGAARRDPQLLPELMEKVNAIWAQAAITFAVTETAETFIRSSILESCLTGTGNAAGLTRLEQYNLTAINIFCVGKMGRTNSKAFSRERSILLADKTTVSDFRAAAFALGVVLGLHSTKEEDRLMTPGKNGTKLLAAETDAARRRAAELLDELSHPVLQMMFEQWRKQMSGKSAGWGKKLFEFLKFSPDHRLFLNAIDRCSKGQYDRAISEFTALFEKHPEAPWIYYFRGNALLFKGEVNRAIKDFTAGLPSGKPVPWAYHLFRGMAYALMADSFKYNEEDTKAKADMDRACSLNPDLKESLEMWNFKTL